MDLELPPEQGGTRCRVEILPGDGRPVVILGEMDDNPGLPVSAAFLQLAAAVRALMPHGPEPLWIEEWRGRALSALVRGRPGVTTYMAVDPRAPFGKRQPVDPGYVQGLRRDGC